MVRAQALERGVANLAFRRPLGEFDFSDQRRLDPLDRRIATAAPATAGPRFRRKRALVHLQFREPLAQVRRRHAVPAGANAAGVSQFALGVDTQRESADLSAGAFAVGEAADDKLLAKLALRLQPALGARRHIGGVCPLEHQAFQTELAGCLEHLRGRRVEGFAEAHALHMGRDQKQSPTAVVGQLQIARTTQVARIAESCREGPRVRRAIRRTRRYLTI